MRTSSNQPRRAAAAAFIGTTIEFYDFYIYATAAALILGQVFFPSDTPGLSTLAAFGTFAVGFIARPMAGMVFGHLGDRLGRKKMLLFTMLLMGLATTGIGLLPSYASAGIWAPIGLVALRIVQGISVGGEWGGAVLMASEHAPKGRKTFYASFAQLGSPAGLLLALIAFRLVTSLEPAEFADWGWRLPFLASGVLMLIGLAIRFGVEESPEFKEVAEKGETAKYPVLDVLRTCWRQIFFAACAVTIGSAGFFFTNTFMITYVTQYQGISRATILDCLFIVTVLQFISQPISALLAERIGEGRFLMLTALLSMFMPYPMFLLVGTQNLALMTLGIAMAVITLSALYAVIAGYMAQAFPAHLRYSGISIAYQLICAIAGGSTPIIGTLLATHYAGQWLPLAIFFSVLAGISLFGVCGLARLRGDDSTTQQSAFNKELS
ncbi:Major Facilitator Superfamily transporter [Pseudomonas savastanoi pv. glycinea]|uniref:MHS family MFS transporter n=1 Tax=Pseudomonas phytophila TaxID=2867264 RepID=A0ABY6F7Q1_9PSED|nr:MULTISPECIES: MFS transporter [Pseudomonas]MCQ2997954.1 MHS family MFS transporter [Pseudomonas syringae]RMR00413.1 Major Facilitator Superfamily transporter [Pseudomonas savastanoi pv. glycinea]MCD5972542.1 MHS family MFS transporter [Pseudomonas quasicaspiana]MCD5978154.1 MHS family MFS transporter [Pseudomonas quasicaspiana]MCQ2998570.1 MHS family MFS transporter [Pseudomonas syringae]